MAYQTLQVILCQILFFICIAKWYFFGNIIFKWGTTHLFTQLNHIKYCDLMLTVLFALSQMVLDIKKKNLLIGIFSSWWYPNRHYYSGYEWTWEKWNWWCAPCFSNSLDCSLRCFSIASYIGHYLFFPGGGDYPSAFVPSAYSATQHGWIIIDRYL